MFKSLVSTLVIFLTLSAYSQNSSKIQQIESLVSEIKTSPVSNLKAFNYKDHFVEAGHTLAYHDKNKRSATVLRQSNTEYLNDSAVYYAIGKKLLKVEWFVIAGEPTTETRLDFYFFNGKPLYNEMLDRGTYKAFLFFFKQYVKKL